MKIQSSKEGELLKGRFWYEELPQEEINRLKELSRLCKGDILKMTNIAGSGHPGGSISSLDIYLVVFSYAKVFPDNPDREDRDRIVISHGHTSPAVYAVMGRLGFFDVEEAISTFRKAGSIFEGHVERAIPGVEWSTGNLGQGLSAGCGFALAAKVRALDYHTFVLMSDAEQVKGQVSEARKFAKKFGLNNITVVIDYNNKQISGNFMDVMPMDIKSNYEADGWKVIEVDGHDYQALYKAIKTAIEDESAPYAVIAKTVMGKGISFMENDEQYHGRALKEGEIKAALEELQIENDRPKFKEKRAAFHIKKKESSCKRYDVAVDTGEPFTYSPDDKVDNRAAFGKALLDVGKRNCGVEGKTPIIVFDCDLMDSVRTGWFAKELPDYFFEMGVQEHNTATVAGASSVCGVISVFADFGVFGISEVYNQHRLNDINCTNLKLILTHLGLDVGQDGKTHHCIDYIGLIRNLFGFKLIIPADANQMDRAVRYILARYGNYAIGMGRESQPIILDEKGNPIFGGDYTFEYGKMDVVREGSDATILSYGNMLHRAIKAAEQLAEKGVSVRVVNVPCVLDPDIDTIAEFGKEGPIIVYEDHHIGTGLGSIVADKAFEKGLSFRLRKMGVKRYAPSGVPEELYEVEGLSVKHLIDTIWEELK